VQRGNLEHLIRAVSNRTRCRDILVIGSQSILGSFTEDVLPADAIESREADFATYPDPSAEMAEIITGALGEMSDFDRSFGYYADGVDLTTASLPSGWKERLVVLDTPSTDPGRGLCLHPNDCAISKLCAFRPKDLRFVSALLRGRFIDRYDLYPMVEDVPGLSGVQRNRIYDWLDAQDINR
jgi:hypothetical protein